MSTDETPHKHENAWYQIVHHVMDSILTSSNLEQHHFDSENHFVFRMLQKITQNGNEPYLKVITDRFTHILQIGKLSIERPVSTDLATGTVEPTYPYHARWEKASYTASVKCNFVYKLVRNDLSVSSRHIPEEPSESMDVDSIIAEALGTMGVDRSSPFNTQRPGPIARPATKPNAIPLEEMAAFVANVGELVVQVRGDLCRIKGSGLMCNEDPDDNGGYHIFKGGEKVTEAQFLQRSNHIYVHFRNASSSATQSASAAEAINPDSAIADKPVILECDYRPYSDEVSSQLSAFHMFLLVDNPKMARQYMDKQMKRRTFDSECFWEASSPSKPCPPHEELLGHTSTSQLPGRLLLGEQCDISFPNVDELNFNLITIMFLLGIDRREDMIRCIIPSEVEWLRRSGVIDDHCVLLASDADKLALLEKHNHLRQAYLIFLQVYAMIHNQSLFEQGDIVDPEVVYYPPSNYVLGRNSGNFASTPGTYEYILKNHMPFVGQDVVSQSNGSYATAKLDGWNRAAVLAHIARLIIVRGSNKKVAAAAYVPTEEDRKPVRGGKDYGKAKQDLPSSRHLPDEVESARLNKSFVRFARCFTEELLPHIGTSPHWRVVCAKRCMLGFMTRKIIVVYMGYLPPDQQDDFKMKCAELPGHNMERVWAQSWHRGTSKLLRTIVGLVEDPKNRKRNVDWAACAVSCLDRRPFNAPMHSGVWPRGGASSMKLKGTTKPLRYANIAALKESMRTVRTVTNEKGGSRMKDSPAQQIDPSHDQKVCTQKAANDKNAGIDLTFALGTRMRIGYSASDLLKVIMKGSMEQKDSPFYNHFNRLHNAPSDEHLLANDGGVYCIPPMSVAVMVNGGIVGYTLEPLRTLNALLEARSGLFFPSDVSITWVNGPLMHNLKNGYSSNDERLQCVGPLLNPFYNYIHVCGSKGAFLSPYFDASKMGLLPSLVMTHTSATGIFPNYTLLQLAKHCTDPLTLQKMINHAGDFNLGPRMLFTQLINHGVIVYRHAEEMAQELECASVRDMLQHMHHYDQRSITPQTLALQTGRAWNFEGTIAATCDIPPAGRHSRQLGVTYSLCKERRSQSSSFGSLSNENPAFSLCVISEAFMLGVSASTQTQINSGDACRSSYSTGMTLQASGPIPLNITYKKNTHHLYVTEPQTSLVPSPIHDVCSIVGGGSAIVPSITCFMSHPATGEDGVLRSQSAWGLFDILHMNTTTTSATRRNARNLAIFDDSIHSKETQYLYDNPSKSKNVLTLKSNDYSSVGNEGFPVIGSQNKPGAAFIGRVFRVGAEGSKMQRDGSITNKSRMTTICDGLSISKSSSKSVTIHVRRYAVRCQVHGDKLSSRHGQKGVAGAVLPRWLLPYLSDRHGRGMTPELFRGPNGVTSRATLGENREIMDAEVNIKAGKSKIIHSWEDDMCLFTTMRKIDANLSNFGFISESTGQFLQTSISMGILDNRTMRHLARESLKSRVLGAVDPRTRQPTSGGAKGGGGDRIGSMELLNQLSHGAADEVEQLLFSGSDPGFAHVCCACGMLASAACPQLLFGHAYAGAVPSNSVSMQRANIFKERLMLAQGGPVHSSAAGNPFVKLSPSPLPSGGWCNGCGTAQAVFLHKMPAATRFLLEYSYLIGQSWRLLTNRRAPSPCKRENCVSTSPSTLVSMDRIDFGRMKIRVKY